MNWNVITGMEWTVGTLMLLVLIYIIYKAYKRFTQPKNVYPPQTHFDTGGDVDPKSPPKTPLDGE